MSVELLAGPVYDRLWAAARRRVEANGLSLLGTPLLLKGLTDAEADAVVGLLGFRRPTSGSPVRVPLAALDEVLRRSAVGLGLFEVLTRLGGALVDRRAEHASSSAERAGEWAALGSHAAVGADDRLTGWLDHVRRTGLDRRLAGVGGAAAVRTALDVLGVLGADAGESGSASGGGSAGQEGSVASGASGGWGSHRLAVLAAEVAGDAHALDRGRPAGTLVVHALTWLRDSAFPQDAADWRRAWADAGVACDDLSCDVLVLNLPGFPLQPLRLTLRQVMSWHPPAGPRGVVLVCENPAVVAAVSDRHGSAAPPVVCVDGMPSTAALLVLEQFSRDSHLIQYHGDFDWRGLVIAGVVARKVPSVLPWKYSAVDYERAIAAGLGTLELAGRTAISPWDPELAPAMARAGRAVYEEQVLGTLLDDV